MQDLLKPVAIAAALMLAGCGGGGSDSPPPPAAPSIQGFWNDADSSTLITSTGELWTVEVDGTNAYLGRGSINVTGNSFTGTITVYSGNQSASGTVGGTFIERQSLAGTSVANGISSSFALTYDNSYNTAPSLTSAAGAYAVLGGGSITIASGGAVTAEQGGCAATGTITPDSSGRNFYRVALTFGAAPCVMPGAAAAGIAVVSGSNLVAGIVSGSVGVAFFASKP